MRRVLVTGGLGFLGSHLVSALLAEGSDVTVVDNRQSPVVGPELFPNCRHIEADASALEPDGVAYDEIYHLADVAGPARILGVAGWIGERTIAGAAAVMRLAARAGSRTLLVSTSEIYGRPGSYAEEDPALIYTPYTVRLEYAVAKALAEISSLNRARVDGTLVNVVRPFNIAGPRQSSAGGFVVPRFFEAALAGEPITVFGTGRQVRCFTHVLDTVDSLIRVARCPLRGQVFNSGNPANRVAIADLAVAVRRICASDSPVVSVDPRDLYGPLYAEAFDKIPKIDRIREATGWTPSRTLEDILADVLAFYQRERSAGATAPGAAPAPSAGR